MSPLTQQTEWEFLSTMLIRLGGRARVPGEVQGLLWVVLELCEATSCEHARGAYGALGPESIMVEREHCRVLILHRVVEGASMVDAAEDTSLTGVGAELEGAAYMAPEQAWERIRDFDARTDVYCIGGVLHSILGGRPPHDGGSPAADLALARIGALALSVTVGAEHPLVTALWRIARRALSAAPSARHPTAVILKADIARALARFGAAS